MARKIIITVATTGSFQGKEANPALPEQPEEIAAEVKRCCDAGAAIAHIHARDKNGVATNDVNIFRQINQLVRERCGIIIQNSMAPKLDPDYSIDEGLQVINAGGEMISLDIALLVVSFRGVQQTSLWTRDWCRNALKLMNEKGIKPELELFNPQSIEDVNNFFIPEGLVSSPYSCTLVMGMNRVSQGAMEYSLENLLHVRKKLPPNSHFSVMGIGQHQLEASLLSIILGGNVRVGFEDNVYYGKGELAKNNAQLVERVVRYARDLGLEIATPSEARTMLGIPQLLSGKSV